MSPQFTILPCTIEDMAACVDIFNDAFASDPALRYFHPRSDPVLLRERAVRAYETGFGKEGTRFFKVLDGEGENGEIVAFSKWVYPHTPSSTVEDGVAAIRNEAQPPGSNNELVVEFLTTFLRAREKWVVPETDYLMALLAVRPSHQRLGLGSLLLTPVLKQADVEGAKVFVQASKEGMGLYARFGWEEVDEVVIDFSAYGGEKVKTALMIRDPEPRKAKKEL